MTFPKSRIINVIKNRNSLEYKLLILQICLVLFWLAGILVILTVTDTFGTLNNQSYNKINSELVRTEKALSDELIIMSQTLYKLTNDINKSVHTTIKKDGLSIANLPNNSQSLSNIISNEVEKSLFAMEKSGSSGVFLILNTTVNLSISGAENSKAGFYIKATQPNRLRYLDSSPVLLRGPSEISREYEMYLDTEWQLEFNFNSADYNDYFYKPFNNANISPDKDLKDLSYWSKPFNPDINQKSVIAISTPLIDKSGLVYGVCGLEISKQFLNEHIVVPIDPKDEPSYIIALEAPDGSIDLANTISLGKRDGSLAREGILNNVKTDSSFTTYTDNAKSLSFDAIRKEINIYNSTNLNNLDNWILLAYSTNKSSSKIGLLTILIILLTGVAITLAWLISKIYTKPIKSSFNKIIDNQTKIDKTDIVEIDRLIEFIEGIQTTQQTDELNVDQDVDITSNDNSPMVEDEQYITFREQLASLTKTEREIFDLYIKGFSTNEILEDRYISINTLKSHNSKIYTKMGVKSRSMLLAYCYQMMNDYKGY